MSHGLCALQRPLLRPSSSHDRPRAEHLSPDLSPGILSFRPRLEPARSPSEPSPSLLAGVPGRRDQAAHRRSRLLWLFQWMKDMWRSDPCYAEYGVDGSTCSFFIYLSEVSSFLWLCGVWGWTVCSVAEPGISKAEKRVLFSHEGPVIPFCMTLLCPQVA